jgi:diguanylate cyclase (GGDEF)-like protein
MEPFPHEIRRGSDAESIYQVYQKLETTRYRFFARYGGEEFLIVLPETDVNSAGVVAEGLHSKASQRLTKMQWEEKFITASFGATGFNSGIPNERISPEAIIRKVDKHLYQAKRKERHIALGRQLVVRQTQR